MIEMGHMDGWEFLSLSWRRLGNLCQRGCRSWERGGAAGQGGEGLSGTGGGVPGEALPLESLMPLGLAAGVRGQLAERGAGRRKKGGEEGGRR